MIDSIDRLLAEKDVKDWLGISIPTLHRMRANGTGPCFVQLSTRRIAYRRSDIEAWIAQRITDRIGGVEAHPHNI